MFTATPKTTLLFIGRDRLVRFDVRAGSGKVLGLWQCPRPSREELPALVEITLRQTKARPGKVWILSVDLWTQVLEMPREMTQGLRPEETGRALAFEAESLSGTSALDSEIGFVPCVGTGETHDFRAVLLATWLRDQLDEIVRHAKGTLAGITHPGGLPQCLVESGSILPAASLSAAWQRLEIWPGAMIGIARDAEGSLRQFVNHADLRGTGWKANWDRWVAANGSIAVVEQLIDMGLSLPAALSTPDGAVRRLEDEATLTAWLIQWAAALSQNDKNIPLIIPAKRPVSVATRAIAACLLAGVVASVAAVDGWMLRSQITAAKAEIAQKQAETKKFDALEASITKGEKQFAERSKAVAKFEQESTAAAATLDAHRTRWAFLLESLGRHAPEELAIREISKRSGRLTIHGVCLGPHAANELATNLSGGLAKMGWTVSPARKTLGKAAVATDPWQFELELAEAETPVPEKVSVIATTPRDAAPAKEPPR